MAKVPIIFRKGQDLETELDWYNQATKRALFMACLILASSKVPDVNPSLKIKMAFGIVKEACEKSKIFDKRKRAPDA